MLSATAVLITTLGFATSSGQCPWTDFISPPTITPDGGVIFFTQEVDRDWWSCAKKAGGTLTLEYLIGDGGQLSVKKTQRVSSAKLKGGAYRSMLCTKDLKAKQLQFRLTGTGEMERLSYTSAAHPVEMCPRCDYKSYNTLTGLMFLKRVELNISVDEPWFACAKRGSTWEVRFYGGESRDAVMAAIKPTYVHNLIHSAKHIKEPISYGKVCGKKNHPWLAWEVVGTAEMKPLSYNRVAVEARGRCK